MAQYAVYTAEGRKRKTLYGKTRAVVAEKLTRAMADRDGGLSIFNPSNLRNRSLKRIKERSGVREDLCFHDLRHTCATLLLREGVNVKVVSEMLGHASITITLNIYAHVLPDMQDSAANAMEAALGGVL
jgi:integrase